MADNKEVIPPRNDWEVVSLTASAYAAAPCGAAEVIEDDGGYRSVEDEAELAHALFMSHHFVFPPSKHENLPLEVDASGILDVNDSKFVDFNLVAADNVTSSGNNEEDWNCKGTTILDEFPGILLFDERGNRLSIPPTEEGIALKGNDEEHDARGGSTFGSFNAETASGGSTKPVAGSSVNESCGQGLSLPNTSISESPSPVKSFVGEQSGFPCEAWWKRRAVSFYAHAKETNSFWSIFVAATVMGLVILGQHWQQERWQTLQLKWQSSINSGNAGRLLGPITRLKDVIVSSQRRLI